MKLLIFSDNHFCERYSILTKFGTKYYIRLENQLESLNWIENLAIEKNCDLVLCAGDFFDKPQLTDQELTAIRDIKWNGLPHYFLVGNHESEENDLQFNSTKALEGPNRFVKSSPELVEFKDCEIAFEQIKLIVSDMWEDEKMLDLSDDGAVVSRFNDCLSRYRFSIIPEWRQTLLSISELLESSELRQALIIYNNLSQIESISCKVPSRNELKTVFSKIITMIDSEESSSEAIIVKKEIQMVLDAINEVAGEKRVWH